MDDKGNDFFKQWSKEAVLLPSGFGVLRFRLCSWASGFGVQSFGFGSWVGRWCLRGPLSRESLQLHDDCSSGDLPRNGVAKKLIEVQ